MLSAVNVLPNSLEISDLREMFSSSIFLWFLGNSDKSGAVQISGVFLTCGHVDSQRVFKNRSFQALK